MKSDIDKIHGYKQALDICDKMNLELLELPKVIINQTNIKCQCKYHNTIKVINYGRLKRGHRQFDCCHFTVTHLYASMYLYVLQKYPNAVLNGNVITIEDTNDIIIFKAIGKIKEPYRDGKIIYHPTHYDSWESRKKIISKLLEIIGKDGVDYEYNNWLESAEYMSQFETYNPIEDKYESDSIVLTGDGLKTGDPNNDELFNRVARVELAHIVATNKAMEIVAEFKSYNEIVNQIKSGSFLGLNWFID